MAAQWIEADACRSGAFVRSCMSDWRCPLAVHVGEDSSTIFVSEFESCCGYQQVNRLWRIVSDGAIATVAARGAGSGAA